MRGVAWSDAGGRVGAVIHRRGHARARGPRARGSGSTSRTPARRTWRRSAACLDIHPLVIEDIAERNQRAKVEYTDDLMHLVVFALVYQRAARAGGARHRPRQAVPADLPSARLAAAGHRRRRPQWPGHFLAKGVDVALYAVLDAIVDGYFPMVDRLSDVTDDLEDQVVQQARPGRRGAAVRRPPQPAAGAHRS